MKWSDDMIREYFDAHLNATIHDICALSGRTRADVKRALMQGARCPANKETDR